MDYNPAKDMLEVMISGDDDFLKVKETLTRIGVASKDDKRLYQSCHILHKKKKYYIVHFKELFALDGLPCDISDNDVARRNTIANLLVEWGLITLPEGSQKPTPVVPLEQIKILSYRDKKDWKLVSKYEIGSARNLRRFVVQKQTDQAVVPQVSTQETVHV